MKPRLFVFVLLVSMMLVIGLAPATAQSEVTRPHPPRVTQTEDSVRQSRMANSQEVVGRLSLIWGDSAPGAPVNHPLKYFLTDEQLNRYELVIDADSAVTPGDLLLLNGERVRVTGQARSAPARPGEATPLFVSALAAAPDGTVTPDVSGNSPWVSVMCKFSDVSDEPQAQQYFQDMYGNSRPGLDHYWREVSYNYVNVQGSGAFGWYTLPHPRSYYVDDDLGETDLGALVNDCTAVADADVYFPDYVGINLMFNDWLGCCAWGGGSYLNLDGVEQSWRTTWEPPWAYSTISVIYHEMGHGFGMPHSSGDYGYVYDSVWDVMSADRYNCDDEHVDPVYGCLGQNTIAFHHDLVEWFTPDQVYLAELGNHSLTLEQLDQPQTDDYLMAKIPVRGSTMRFFTVEVRRTVGYDAKLPGNAVIIHEVNLNWSQPAHVVDIDWNEDTADEGAMWRVGETFTDDSGDISITVDAATATGFDITIENNSQPPVDPFEPNDTPEDATPIAYGDDLFDALIQVPGDQDWYVFQGNANDYVELFMDAYSMGSNLQPHVYLYRMVNGELDPVRDDSWWGDVEMWLELPANGEYYLLIEELDHDQDGGPEYFYDLSLYLEPEWDYTMYYPEADAYVSQAAKTTNYGAAPILRVKNAAADMNAYLKFWVDMPEPPAGQCFREPHVWLRAYIKEPSTDGGSVYSVGNNWNENTIIWNNAPPIGGAPVGLFGSVSDESFWFAGLENYPLSDGYHSFAIRNGSSNSVDYSSTEGGYLPAIELGYYVESTHKPRATPDADDWSDLAPMTAHFTAEGSGCPMEYYWDFGDGTTTFEQNPTHTYSDPGWYNVRLTVSNGVGYTTHDNWLQVLEPLNIAYISPAANANIGGIPAQAADILRYDKATNGWTMAYDGSAHGTLKNITAFSFDDYGDLLLVFGANQAIPGLGTATPRDVVRFSPNAPWAFPLGSGSWSWYLRGSWPNVGLTTKAEAIDGINEQWNDLIVSSTGAATLPTNPVTKVADEDLFYWMTGAPAWSTWLEIDGSNIPGMAAEDINGVWYDTDAHDYYVTISGPFNLNGTVGDGKSIVRLRWDNGWQASLHPWLAAGVAFPTTIDAIELAR